MCTIQAGLQVSELNIIYSNIFPTNSNNEQEFILEINPSSTINNNSSNNECRYVKITFPTSTDFYGRIIIYKLHIFGFII